MQIKKALSILSVFVCFITLGAVAQVNIGSGLIAYYPFNGDATDSSGNGHNGQVNNATLTADRFSKSGSAYYFDGSKKGITIPALGNFGATGASISLWVKTTKQSSALEPIDGIIGSFYLNVYKNGSFLAAFDGTVGNNTVADVSTSTITTGSWVHLVATNDGNTTKIYVNGALENTYPEVLKTGGSDFIIANKNFKGCIDDIRIYNRALSSTEVSYIYQLPY